MRRLAPQRLRDRWLSIALSVLLHGALLAALVYGWLLFRRPPRPAPTLAIEATVVDERAARGAARPTPQPAPPAAAPTPEPAPPPPEATGPPQPTPEELAQREQQRQQAEAAAEQRRLEAEKAAAEAAAAAAAAQREAEARAAAERKARDAAEAQKRAEEQKRADAQKRAEEQQQAEEQEDLKRSLAAEEQARTERSGPARANWVAQIAARINRAWLRPPTARAGIECQLEVTQVPGGTVTKVTIGQCNGDQAVRESIEAAVYRASPLPSPPDPAMFDPVLHIDFKPD